MGYKDKMIKTRKKRLLLSTAEGEDLGKVRSSQIWLT